MRGLQAAQAARRAYPSRPIFTTSSRKPSTVRGGGDAEGGVPP